jgi:hypothetical protein
MCDQPVKASLYPVSSTAKQVRPAIAPALEAYCGDPRWMQPVGGCLVRIAVFSAAMAIRASMERLIA